ncbi:MAG: hypothetical protein ACWA42_01745 [Lutibacter sp.]
MATGKKSVGQVTAEILPSIVLGGLGKTLKKAIRKAAGSKFVKEGGTKLSEMIIKANEKVYEKIITKKIIPKIDEKK